MEIQMIADYIDAPYKMNEEDFKKIEELLEKYPFFHTANMLFIKAAHNINYQEYDSLINKVSASIPNREILHSLINLKEVIVEETVKEKEEKVETGARKEIRERLMKRRKQRQLEKGEILSDDGKPWHKNIIDDFFKPSIEDLVKEFNKTIGKSADEVVVEEISTDKQTEKAKDVPKVKETKVKTEKTPAKEEKTDLKTEDQFTNIVILPGEKTKDDPVKMQDDDEVKVETEDIRDTKPEIAEEKVSEVKEEVKEEKSVEVKEEIKEDKIIEEKTEDIKKAEDKPRIIKKTKQIIIEDIESNEIDDGKDEGEVIENIYDRIITSKKPKVETEKKPEFVEIEDDITGLEDKSEEQKKTPETKDQEVEISTEEKTEIKDEKDDEISIIEDKQEIIKEEEINVHEDIKDEIELISDDEDIKVKEPEKVRDSKSQTDADQIVIEDDTDDEIEIAEEFELIEKKEDEKEKKSEPEKKEELTEEKPFLKKEEKVESEKNEDSDVKEEVKAETSEKVKEEVKEEKQKIKTEEKKELTEKEIKAKAADDVFARIAAYKKKKQQTDPEKKDSKEEDDLIEKFVKEEPKIKRPDKDAETNEVSVEEHVEQKPVVTELMASIYINQGKYDQAIEIYEQLILKNPEKKDYFAAKIEETEKLK